MATAEQIPNAEPLAPPPMPMMLRISTPKEVDVELDLGSEEQLLEGSMVPPSILRLERLKQVLRRRPLYRGRKGSYLDEDEIVQKDVWPIRGCGCGLLCIGAYCIYVSAGTSAITVLQFGNAMMLFGLFLFVMSLG